jgi:hypothetical protein
VVEAGFNRLGGRAGDGPARPFDMYMGMWLCLVPLCSLPCPRSTAEARRQLWANRTGYDREVRPKVAERLVMIDEDRTLSFDSPVSPETIKQAIVLVSLGEVDAAKQRYKVHVEWRQLWIDQRLQYNSSCGRASGTWSSNSEWNFKGSPQSLGLWQPAIFPQNQYEEPEATGQDGVWIAANGRVWWDRKVFLSLTCDMDFTLMPFDMQACIMRMTSTVEANDEINLAPHAPAVDQPCNTYVTSNEWVITNLTALPVVTHTSLDSASYDVLDFAIEFTRQNIFYLSSVTARLPSPPVGH